jgi:hypothetical protein
LAPRPRKTKRKAVQDNKLELPKRSERIAKQPLASSKRAELVLMQRFGMTK